MSLTVSQIEVCEGTKPIGLGLTLPNNCCHHCSFEEGAACHPTISHLLSKPNWEAICEDVTLD